MEAISLAKPTQQKKKRETRIQSVYSRCLITRKIVLPITTIGKNLKENIEENIKTNYEGKCVVEGYIKPNSSKIITYSSGIIQRGNNILFDVVFECDVCFPVEGMLVPCVAKNITKAGIRAESANDVPSPIVVFVAKDHHYSNSYFAEVQEGDKITVKVIGQRFELNDKYISIIGELVKEKDFTGKPKTPSKPRLVIEE
jgi:DNA-directed RNA polymerase subunit E'/Rpb7